MTSGIDVLAVIICDDVRKEVTNKDIIIGVYAGDILVPTFPAWINVAAWMEVVSHSLGERNLAFRIGISGKPGPEFHLKLHTNKIGPLSVAIPSVTMRVDEETELTLEIREDDAWRPLRQKKILKGRSTLPLVPPALGGGAPSDG